MATKDTSLTISVPRQGISQSPHIGFADVRNIDIYSVPGVAKLNNILSKVSSTTVDAQITWFARHPSVPAKIYAIDTNGSVYYSATSGATWSELSDRAGAGQGLIVWKDYLFVCEDTTIDVYGPISGTPAWTDNWQTIDSDTTWHPIIVSKNDSKIYGGAGRFIFTIDENTGKTFAPGDATTYTFTAQALDLPVSYRIKCLEELGNNLMIGTWQGTNVYDIRIADIFPWDRSSTSFGQPIVFDEYGIHALKNIGGSLVVLAGTSGTIYRCDGANKYIIGQIPTDLSGGKYIEFYPGSLCTYKNKIFFGTGNGGTTAVANQGIYSLYQTGKGNVLNLEHLNSALTDGSVASVKISALLPVTRDTILTGWRSNTTYGIDLSSATSYSYSTDYSGFFITPLYTVGTYHNKRTFSEIEFQLAKELATGEGIKLEYRVNLTDSFTAVKTPDNGTLTLTYATLGSITNHIMSADIPATDMLQLRVSLLGTSTTTPELKTIILR